MSARVCPMDCGILSAVPALHECLNVVRNSVLTPSCSGWGGAQVMQIELARPLEREDDALVLG